MEFAVHGAGYSMSDVFEGVEFRWTSVPAEGGGRLRESWSLELSFDAEHTDMALGRRGGGSASSRST
jgi:chaperone BCS1